MQRSRRADPWLTDHPASLEWFEGQFEPGETPPDAEILALLSDQAAGALRAASRYAELRNYARKLEQSDRALRDSEEKYRAIFENVQDVYYRTDMHGTMIEVSPAAGPVMSAASGVAGASRSALNSWRRSMRVSPSTT